jgi:hypothetical protein
MTIKKNLTRSKLQLRGSSYQAELDKVARTAMKTTDWPRKANDRGAWEKKRIQVTVGDASLGSPRLISAPSTAEASINSAENTDLERRVLAHERILQSLIAHMAETEPKFVDRLVSTFSEPMQFARREHDYTDTDSYAERFVREIIRLGEPSNYPIVVRKPSKRPDNSSRAESVGIEPQETLRTLFR